MKMGKLTLGELGGLKNVCAVFLFCAATAIGSSAQTFSNLFDFTGLDGGFPFGSLVQGLDGNFYGTTSYLGFSASGTIFKISPDGTLGTILSFNVADGSFSDSGLVLATDGSFYGTTSGGGVYARGTVFKNTPTGTLTTLYSFCSQGLPNCPDGSIAYAGLVQGADGNFYGTTEAGGNICADSNGSCGTVFKITREGKLTTLYRFCAQTNCPDGSLPLAGLVQATDGNFYGTTSGGGANSSACFGAGCGTVFKISPAGRLTTLYSFCSQKNCADGNVPRAGLVQASDGDFYGTTSGVGGSTGSGTVFKITPKGALTTLYSFCPQGGPNCADGSYPYAGLVQATDGNFYGSTLFGGANKSACGGGGCGTLFKITSAGNLTTLYSFCSQTDCTDGAYMYAALMQATNGNFFGTTESGGARCADYGSDCGTVFSLSVGLGPFVSLPRASGRVGQSGHILGQGFTGTTGVFLNGTPASFEVISDTNIRATVPVGATTGFITVNTPTGTLTSNVVFRVTP